MKIFTRIAIGLFALIVVGDILWSQIPSRAALKARRVNQAVSTLSIGSDKNQVIKLLRSEKMGFSVVNGKESLNFSSEVSKNGFSSHQLSGYIIAIIRDTSRSFLVSGDTQYFFFFDSKGKLLKATHKEVFTGP